MRRSCVLGCNYGALARILRHQLAVYDTKKAVAQDLVTFLHTPHKSLTRRDNSRLYHAITRQIIFQGPLAMPVMLTTKERKKLRRQRRATEEHEKRDKIRLGLLTIASSRCFCILYAFPGNIFCYCFAVRG